MTYYLGPAGGLVPLPEPEAPLPVQPVRLGGTHQLLSGSSVRDTLGYSRRYDLTWTTLDLTSYGLLEGFAYGGSGITGPYLLLDPEQRNYLNNANSGAVASSFGVSNSGGIANPTIANIAPTYWGSLYTSAMTVRTNQALTSSQFQYVSPRYVPVYPGLTYTFSAQAAKYTGGIAGLQLNVVQFDKTLTYISETSNTLTALSSTGGYSLSHTVTTVATAAYLLPRLRFSSADGDDTAVVWALQLERGSSASTFAPGAGVPYVTVDSLTSSTPVSGVRDAQMTLLEVSTA